MRDDTVIVLVVALVLYVESRKREAERTVKERMIDMLADKYRELKEKL